MLTRRLTPALTTPALVAEVGVVATWPWIWVCSPFWIPLLIVIGVFALIITIKR